MSWTGRQQNFGDGLSLLCQERRCADRISAGEFFVIVMKAPGILAVAALVASAWPLTAPGAPAGGDAPKFEDWNRPYVEMQFSGVAGAMRGGWSAGFEFILAGGGYGFHSTLVAPVRWDEGGVRPRDWDERGDYGRVIGLIGYRDKSGDIDVGIQSLRGYTLGAGNLVSMLFSTVDQDHWRTGVSARLHWPVAGVDLFLDSFLDPSLFGGRVYIRPLWFADRAGNLGRLEIGGSVVTDVFAPSTFGSGTMERPGPVLPDRYGLVAADPDALTGGAIDVRWPVAAGRIAELTPWAAWSRLGAADAGHVGMDMAFNVAKGWKLSLSGEYDYMESGFATGYFDNLYMADRYDFGVLRDGFAGAVSKQAVLESTGFDRHGGSVGAGVSLDPWMSAWFRADIDRNGMYTRLRAGATVTVPDRLLLTGTVVARGFGIGNDSPTADRVSGSIAADVTVWKFIGVFASYSRDMYVPVSGPDIGRYVTGNTGLAGLRFTFGMLPGK